MVTVAASRRRDGRSFISCHFSHEHGLDQKHGAGMPDVACQNSEFRYILPRWHVHPPLVVCAICHKKGMPHAACGMKPPNRHWRLLAIWPGISLPCVTSDMIHSWVHSRLTPLYQTKGNGILGPCSRVVDYTAILPGWWRRATGLFCFVLFKTERFRCLS